MPALQNLAVTGRHPNVRVAEDVKAIWDIREERCQGAGRRVGAVINYDRFRICISIFHDHDPPTPRPSSFPVV
jgi:hypothetical protein